MRILQYNSDTFWLQIYIIIGIVGVTIYWLLKPYNKHKEKQLRELHLNILSLHTFSKDFNTNVDEMRKKYYSLSDYFVAYGIGFHCKPEYKRIVTKELENCADRIIKDKRRLEELKSYRMKLNNDIFLHFKTKVAPRLQEELDTIQFSDVIFDIFKDMSQDNKSLDLNLFLDRFSKALNISMSVADNIIFRIANTEPSLREGSPNLSLIKLNPVEKTIRLGEHWGYEYTYQYPNSNRGLWDIFRYDIINKYIGFKYKPIKFF